MRLLPQSSFWRTVLMVWLVVLVSQAAILTFVAFYFYTPNLRQTASLLDLEIDTLEAGIRLAGRDAMLQAMRAEREYQIVEDLSLVPSAADSLVSGFFLTSLQHTLGDKVEVRLTAVPETGVWITHEKLDGIWIHYPLKHVGQYEGLVIMTWSIGTPLLALVVAALFVRQLNRPLKQLETAVRRIGRGEPVTNLSQNRGPQEIIALNQAFNQMRKDLQQATRERALLLAGISHDLRTPLTRMRLTVELLGGSDPELTDGIIRDIEDMDAILDQFIAFIRDGNEESTELGDLNEVIEDVALQFETEGVSIGMDLQPLPAISLKRLSLKRLFANLLGNAIRHGGGEIEIFSGLHDGEIRVVVADRGPGLSDKAMMELFQPFARGDESRGTLGSGLGLAIARRIVDMHHGRIELQNRSGGGLQAIVSLPVTGEFVPPDSMLSGIR